MLMSEIRKPLDLMRLASFNRCIRTLLRSSHRLSYQVRQVTLTHYTKTRSLHRMKALLSKDQLGYILMLSRLAEVLLQIKAQIWQSNSRIHRAVTRIIGFLRIEEFLSWDQVTKKRRLWVEVVTILMIFWGTLKVRLILIKSQTYFKKFRSISKRVYEV
jgi:hypothetical protein